MTSDRRAGVVAGPGVRPFEVTDHRCFACGSLNEHGLGLLLHVESGRSWTELVVGARFEGWAGIAHGGIVCTVLDEVMAWALVGDGDWGLTARMAIDFKRPLPIGTPVRAEGAVTNRRRRLVDTDGRIVDPATGAVIATATGTYVAADAARRAALQEQYGFRYLDGATPERQVGAAP